ncbi:MAG: ABC transporter substrate-binding protein [Patescibacteria group bacterium]
MFSFLRILGKTHHVSVFGNAEEKVKNIFTPSDWLVSGLFVALATLGVGILFANASLSLSEEVPVLGGMYREGVVGTPRFINPLLATSETDKDLSTLVYGGLMKQSPNGSVIPYLADRYDISEDALQYTFYLKDNIFFHDGTPITAEDVVYTIQAAKNPEIKSPRRANWEGVEVVATDAKTVVFSLRAPYALFLENTTMGILPKHLWAHIPSEGFAFSDLNTNPIGSGMYEVTTIKKNASGIPSEYQLTIAKNTPLRPYIRSIVFNFYSNQTSLSEAFENGAVDAAYSVIPHQENAGAIIEEAVFARVFGVFFNQNQQELFADVVVRRALDQAVDKKEIIDTIISGYGSPLSGPLPPESVSAQDDSEVVTDRVASAQKLLEDNGWKRGEDGVYEKTVKKETRRLKFSLATANAPELKATAEMVATTWRTLGADVSLQFFEQNDLNLEVLRPRKYDALLFGLVVGRELDLFAFWHSSQRNDPGLNIALYANIDADQYLEEARNELDPTLRREKAKRAALEVASEVAAVFLYAPHFTYAHTPLLKGVSLGTISTPSDRFAGVETWYVRTERVWPFFIK